jgi:UPF0271 protein
VSARRLAIDLNADVGEGFGAYRAGDDGAVIPLVSSVNVACGFHGGDPLHMERAVALAARLGVAVGAHPGYYDLRGFGRRALSGSLDEVENDVLYQIGALAAFARAHGVQLTHVKPHGALYNQAAGDESLARAVARAVARFDRGLRFVGLAGSQPMRRAAETEGLSFWGEAFADRAYEADGTLRPRSKPGAVHEVAAAAAQAIRIARDGLVVTDQGEQIPVAADTLCLHGDSPHTEQTARAVRHALESAGIAVRSAAR